MSELGSLLSLSFKFFDLAAISVVASFWLSSNLKNVPVELAKLGFLAVESLSFLSFGAALLLYISKSETADVNDCFWKACLALAEGILVLATGLLEKASLRAA